MASGEEPLNHLGDFSKAHVRYRSGENIMACLANLSAVMNIRSLVRETENRSDTENKCT